jgi:hypothetical protein
MAVKTADPEPAVKIDDAAQYKLTLTQRIRMEPEIILLPGHHVVVSGAVLKQLLAGSDAASVASYEVF